MPASKATKEPLLEPISNSTSKRKLSNKQLAADLNLTEAYFCDDEDDSNEETDGLTKHCCRCATCRISLGGCCEALYSLFCCCARSSEVNIEINVTPPPFKKYHCPEHTQNRVVFVGCCGLWYARESCEFCEIASKRKQLYAYVDDDDEGDSEVEDNRSTTSCSAPLVVHLNRSLKKRPSFTNTCASPGRRSPDRQVEGNGMRKSVSNQDLESLHAAAT
jgi:hypothetical protein